MDRGYDWLRSLHLPQKNHQQQVYYKTMDMKYLKLPVIYLVNCYFKHILVIIVNFILLHFGSINLLLHSKFALIFQNLRKCWGNKGIIEVNITKINTTHTFLNDSKFLRITEWDFKVFHLATQCNHLEVPSSPN